MRLQEGTPRAPMSARTHAYASRSRATVLHARCVMAAMARGRDEVLCFYFEPQGSSELSFVLTGNTWTAG